MFSQIRLSSRPADDFVDNRLSEVDPVFTSHVGSQKYACQRDASDSFARRKVHDSFAQVLDRNLEIQPKQFRNVVAAYEQSKNGKGSKAIDLVNSSSWPDVLNQVEATKQQYNGATRNGFLGSLRARFRKLGDHTTPIEAWLKLLPSGSWQGSLICGGVVIVLKVCLQPR